MRFELSIEDHTIILNALHYYKKVEKRDNFKQYDEERINQLRDSQQSTIRNKIEKDADLEIIDDSFVSINSKFIVDVLSDVKTYLLELLKKVEVYCKKK